MDSPTVAVFVPDCTDARVVKRMRAFKDSGFKVVGVSFRRARYNRDYVPEWDNIDLGRVKDRDHGARLLAVTRSLWILFRERARFKDVSFYYAINLDHAFLALFVRLVSGNFRPVAYEVADVQPPFVRRNLAGAALRFMERAVLRRVALLVVTSPGFMRGYFWPTQGYKGDWFLLENKLDPLSLPRPAVRPVASRRGSAPGVGRRWVIGYFGAIRCFRSWEIIKRIAVALPDRVEFCLRGYPTRLDPGKFFKEVGDIPNIRYEGEYKHPDDLADMYGDIDLVWCFELVDDRHNSRWLLPNRLYEGGYSSVPMLSPKGFEVGDYIEKLGVGWTFEEPYRDNLVRFLNSLSEEEYAAKKDRFKDIPATQFASRSEFEELCYTMLKSGLRGGGRITQTREGDKP